MAIPAVADPDVVAVPVRRGAGAKKQADKESVSSKSDSRHNSSKDDEEKSKLHASEKQRNRTSDDSNTELALPERSSRSTHKSGSTSESSRKSHSEAAEDKNDNHDHDEVTDSRENSRSNSEAAKSDREVEEHANQVNHRTDSASDLTHRIFNTDYKTRSATTAIPESLHGNGYNGYDLPIGQEDVYRNSMPVDFMPSDLVRIPPQFCFDNMPIYLRSQAAESLTRMFSDAARQGLRLQIFSGYRDYQHQLRLYNDAVRRNGKNQRGVAKPGRSEHFLGTTADITSTDDYLMKRSFANTPEGEWLAQNAMRYGWKMTVVSGSGARTHVDEPWHLRYTGTNSSTRMFSQQSLPARILHKPATLFSAVKRSLSRITQSISLRHTGENTDNAQ